MFFLVGNNGVKAQSSPDDNNYLLYVCAGKGVDKFIAIFPFTYDSLCCNDYNNTAVFNGYSGIIYNKCQIAQQKEETVTYDDHTLTKDDCKDPGQSPSLSPNTSKEILQYYYEQCCVKYHNGFNCDNIKQAIIGFRYQDGVTENLIPLEGQDEEAEEANDIANRKNICLNDSAFLIGTNPRRFKELCCNGDEITEKMKATLSGDEKAILENNCSKAGTSETVAGENPMASTQAQSTAQESQSKIVCRAMAKQDYEECGKSGEALWKCRIESWITQVFCQIMYALIDGIGAAISYIMNLEVNAILWAINPQTYGGFSTNPGVREVWTFMRDLVNLVLIIGMIIIAVATMLRIEKWGWKNTLWKLVVVALLVNFSLIIPGMVIDVSNFLSFYFLNAAKGENANLGLAILKSFGFAISNNQATAPAFLDQGVAQIAGGSETTEGVIDYAARQGYVAKFLLIAIALILIGLFAILTLFATFLVMILRAVLMCILLVVAPLAFASWIFPATASYFRKWWSFFIQWCLVPVIFSFLLYTGITILNVSQISQGGILASIIQLVLFSMFLVAGLVISIKQSGGITEKIISGLSGVVTVAMGGLAGVIGGAFSSRVVAGQGTTGQAWKSIAERLEKSRFRPLHNTGLKMQTSTQNVAAEREKALSGRFDKMTAEQIERDILANRKNPFLAAAGFSKLIEKGKLDSTNEELMAVFQKVVNHPAFNKKELKDHRPDLYRQYVQTDQFNKDIQEIMQKQKVNADEASKIAIRNATQEALLKASPEDIKKMDITNILKNLQNIGQLNQTLNELILQRKMDPESLADVFRKMNAQERNEWLQTFKQAMIETKGITSKQELQSEMGRLGICEIGSS